MGARRRPLEVLAEEPARNSFGWSVMAMTFGYYARLSAANRTIITNHPKVTQSYRGLAVTLTKRFSNRWQMLGSRRLGTLNKVDLRVGKLFKFDPRSLEVTVDFDNITNAATVWQVRNRTEAAAFTDPTTGQRATLQQFLSPAAILGPRTVVFRAAFKF